MSKVIRCPDCGCLVALAFPIHVCKSRGYFLGFFGFMGFFFMLPYLRASSIAAGREVS